MNIGLLGTGNIGGCLEAAEPSAPISMASRLVAVLQRLDEADRARLPELRDVALQKVMQLPNGPRGPRYGPLFRRSQGCRRPLKCGAEEAHDDYWLKYWARSRPASCSRLSAGSRTDAGLAAASQSSEVL
jgi:hypothetical protein